MCQKDPHGGSSLNNKYNYIVNIIVFANGYFMKGEYIYIFEK